MITHVQHPRLYGFFGRFPPGTSFTDLAPPGEGSDPAGPGLEHVRTWADGLVWGQHSTTDGDITVALDGSPVWIERPEFEANAQSILAAYRESGIQLLRNLGGRYALAIADRAGRRLLLAVDRMGIARLTYAIKGQAIVFGASAEAVARCPLISAGLDNQALFAYLLHHVIPAPDTAYEGVRKLQPATHLVFAEGRSSLSRHWTPEFQQARGEPLPLLKERLRSTLHHAVQAARPDASTGAFLSGGLDSSTVAGLLGECLTTPAKTFTIGFGFPDYDELPYARLANAKFGCEAHEFIVRGTDIADTFALIARAYDEPYGNSSAMPAYHCARLAKEAGVHHLLAGDGGDELFAGNSRYAEQQIFEWYRHLPRPIRQSLIEPALRLWPQKENATWLVRKARGYVEKALTPLPTRLESWNFIFGLGPSNVLESSFLDSVRLAGPFERMQEVWDSTPSDSTLQRMLFYDWHYTLADNDLRKVEVMCAIAGVRVSYPMLDDRVVALSTSIPPDVMMPGRKLRHFYKQAMTGFLPDEIIHKKKHGFGLPFGLWLQESSQLRDLIFGNLSGLKSRGIVRPELLNRLLDLHGNDDARYYGVFIWVLAMLEQWFQEHGIQPSNGRGR